MIIPQFKLKQDDRCLSIFIRVPYIKVSACQFYIQANTFKFYLKPYLLSLSFQQRLKEVEEPAKAVYYHEKYILEVHLEKEIFGEVFNNLDLISNVVNRKKKEKKKGRVNIQVIGGNETLSQQTEQSSSKLIYNQYNYGFCMQYSNIFDNLQQETIQLFAFNPKDTPMTQRYPLSKDIIRNEFDVDSYLFDKYQNQEEILSVMKDKSFVNYIEEWIQKEKGPQINSQQYRLKMKISKKQLLISHEYIPHIKKDILSLIFSYLYQLICMSGQMGPQSTRTINQTSLVLNCNASYGEMRIFELLTDCYRRCMTYSLYKNLKLCSYVKQNLCKYLSKTYIKVILEDIRRLFDKNQPRYLLNRIYIDDYLLFIYSMKEEREFSELFKEVEECIINENDLELGIQEYENEAANDKNQEKSEEREEDEQQKIKGEEKKLIEEIEKLQTLD